MITSTIKITTNGHVHIPKDVLDSLEWSCGMEVLLTKTDSGILLEPKSHKKKFPAKRLKGFLQHSGKTVPTEKLCRPVEYADDSI